MFVSAKAAKDVKDKVDDKGNEADAVAVAGIFSLSNRLVKGCLVWAGGDEAVVVENDEIEADKDSRGDSDGDEVDDEELMMLLIKRALKI